MGKKRPIVKAGFFLRPPSQLSLDSVMGLLVQQFVPIISSPWLVAGITNK